MWVMHGLVTPAGELALWAEDSTRPPATQGRPGRAAAPHPFTVPAPELRAALSLRTNDNGAGRVGDPPNGTVVTRTLLLPSYASRPVASPELVRDPLAAGHTPRGAVRLRGWLVPTVTLPPAAALDLLGPAAEPPPDTRVGASLRFLAAAAGFAGELVAAGRVLPDVAEGPVARWRPVLTGVDSARYAALRAAMPPSCRAYPTIPGATDGPSSDELLHAAVDGWVDALVRRRLAATSLRLVPGGRVAAADAAAAAWLGGLTGDAGFAADRREARLLGERLTAWQGTNSIDSAVRVCFRLRPPPDDEDDDAPWLVDFLLQAVDEPSVLVPATQVWREHDGVLGRWVDRPTDTLLAGMGRAARLVRDLEGALREARPTGLALDASGAHRFLTRAADLDAAGFGVLLPAWSHGGREHGLGLRLATTGTAASAAPGVVDRLEGISKRTLVAYRWELAVGGEALTSAELARLAAAQAPLVRVRGQWVHADRQRVAAALAFLARAGTGTMSAGDVLGHAAAPDRAGGPPLPVVDVTGDGWLGDLLSGAAEERVEPLDPPPGFTATLRPYQRRGLAWLAFLDRLGLGACLADDMGLGKTVQLLALEALTRAAGPRAPTLVVCPTSMVGTWLREATRFAPGLRVHAHHGADRLAGAALGATALAHDLVVTSYALLVRDVDTLAAIEWDRVVLDEAQNIKNSTARQSRAARRLTARHRVALTGTPVENRLAELWSIVDFLNPGLLGAASTFHNRYAVAIERYGDDDAAARLRRVTAPFLLRRMKSDRRIIDDLPEKLEFTQLCTLTPEQAALYQAVLDDLLARIAERGDGIERKGLVLAAMSKLKQVCDHPGLFLHDGSRVAGRSGKLARLEEIIADALAAGDKIVCFTQFAEFAGMLVPHLSARFDTEVLLLHGGTPARARDAMVERFQADGGPSIFLLSLRAGGTGLTLTAANHVVHLDRWWNPAVEDQATDRAFRIGQRRAVQVRRLVCLGTLEDRIDELMARKRALARLVVGSGDGWLTELSVGQLREVFALSPEAVGDVGG